MSAYSRKRNDGKAIRYAYWKERGLPFNIANQQAAYERRHAILRAVNAGAIQKEIAEYLSVSKTTIWSAVGRARRESSRHLRSPVERYFSYGGDISELRELIAKASVSLKPRCQTYIDSKLGMSNAALAFGS